MDNNLYQIHKITKKYKVLKITKFKDKMLKNYY
jgi:hypothetical protein